MKRSRFTETQIISILNEVDAGLSVKEVSRLLKAKGCSLSC